MQAPSKQVGRQAKVGNQACKKRHVVALTAAADLHCFVHAAQRAAVQSSYQTSKACNSLQADKEPHECIRHLTGASSNRATQLHETSDGCHQQAADLHCPVQSVCPNPTAQTHSGSQSPGLSPGGGLSWTDWIHVLSCSADPGSTGMSC